MKQAWARVGLSMAAVSIAALAVALSAGLADAAAPPPNNPQSSSVGLQGTVPSKPPATGAVIATPANGQTVTSQSVRVSGSCPSGLLVKIFTNNVFVGSAMCVNGNYSLHIDLFKGRNDIVSRVFDALDQPGPDSSVVTVTFLNEQVKDNVALPLTLTSSYARRGVNPSELLTWPISMSGGTGPYAVSVDWGDTQPHTLLSRQLGGTFDISHVYGNAGAYTIVVQATDKDGTSAYLQLVGEANGAVTQTLTDNIGGGTKKETIARISWLPAALALPLIILAFWLGRHYELAALRKHLGNIT